MGFFKRNFCNLAWGGGLKGGWEGLGRDWGRVGEGVGEGLAKSCGKGLGRDWGRGLERGWRRVAERGWGGIGEGVGEGLGSPVVSVPKLFFRSEIGQFFSTFLGDSFLNDTLSSDFKLYDSNRKAENNSAQRGVHSIVNMGGRSKTLGHSNSLSRSIFSTVGSFG